MQRSAHCGILADSAHLRWHDSCACMIQSRLIAYACMMALTMLTAWLLQHPPAIYRLMVHDNCMILLPSLQPPCAKHADSESPCQPCIDIIKLLFFRKASVSMIGLCSVSQHGLEQAEADAAAGCSADWPAPCQPLASPLSGSARQCRCAQHALHAPSHPVV